jgi:rhodanese-related sulfurtransferase
MIFFRTSDQWLSTVSKIKANLISGGVGLNKQYLPYFVVIMFTFVMLIPSIVTAETSSSGYININVSDGKVKIDNENVFLLDVRTPAEFKAAHIEGAKNIPDKNVPANDPEILTNDKLLFNRISEVPSDKPVIVYCLSGGRSLNASKTLVTKGYTNIYNMEPIPLWIDARFPVVSTFVDESNLDKCVKNSLNPKIDRVFLHLEKGDDDKAKQELNKSILFINNTESVGKINSSQASYLRNEIRLIRNMI